MATTSPTPNYGWVLPVPGGSIGAWGTILNQIFGEDTTPLGIDGVLQDIQDEVDAAETTLAALDARVDTLEGVGVTSLFARTYRATSQTISKGTVQKVSFDTESFDNGDLLTSSNSRITVPSGGAGVYLIHTSVRVPYHADFGDDGRQWRLELKKDGVTVATDNTPYLNDGVSGSSGDVTLSISHLDVAADGAFYEVHIFQTFFGSGLSGSALVGGESNSFFEAVRMLVA